jgi:hypothetical protein
MAKPRETRIQFIVAAVDMVKMPQMRDLRRRGATDEHPGPMLSELWDTLVGKLLIAILPSPGWHASEPCRLEDRV